jgi:4,5-DOPA dioxygenase extradiol
VNRRKFIRNTGILLTGMETLKGLRDLASLLPEHSSLMPVIFVGHGSPMNGIETNRYSRTWQQWGATIPKPEAVLCISAHWLTRGTYVTAMAHPRTIHDFSGFPDQLYKVQYPAAGHPSLAREIRNNIARTTVELDHDWGLDHGCWTILRHMYPDATIPVLQLSIDYHQPAGWHLSLAEELKSLRKRNVLIIGSGNMVHNLRLIAWDKPDGFAYDWAEEMNHTFKKLIQKRDLTTLLRYDRNGQAWNLAIPTPDHYLPLIYMLGLTDSKDSFSFYNDAVTLGSISMTSVMAGR